MGFAKEEGEDGGSGAYHREAWRRFDLKSSGMKNEMLLQDYYRYSATRVP